MDLPQAAINGVSGLLSKKTAKAPKTRQQWRPLVTKGRCLRFRAGKKACRTLQDYLPLFFAKPPFSLFFLVFSFAHVFFSRKHVKIVTFC